MSKTLTFPVVVSLDEVKRFARDVHHVDGSNGMRIKLRLSQDLEFLRFEVFGDWQMKRKQARAADIPLEPDIIFKLPLRELLDRFAYKFTDSAVDMERDQNVRVVKGPRRRLN